MARIIIVALSLCVAWPSSAGPQCAHYKNMETLASKTTSMPFAESAIIVALSCELPASLGDSMRAFGRSSDVVEQAVTLKSIFKKNLVLLVKALGKKGVKAYAVAHTRAAGDQTRFLLSAVKVPTQLGQRKELATRPIDRVVLALMVYRALSPTEKRAARVARLVAGLGLTDAP